MRKSELRTHCLEQRSSLSFEQTAEASRKIADLFFDSVDLTGVKRFHCYVPIEKFREIDTLHIFRHIWEQYPAIETLAPRTNFETEEIESAPFRNIDELTVNKWGIAEPAGNSTIAAETIDLTVVPLLCFDERGHRIGYGRGFYDRFLTKCRKDCRKVGLSLFGPVEAIEDIGGHDVTLDIVITPDRLF